MNNSRIANNFKNENSNIIHIKTQHRQIMATIAYRILKFEPMIKNQECQIIHSLLLILSATSIPLLKSTLS